MATVRPKSENAMMPPYANNFRRVRLAIFFVLTGLATTSAYGQQSSSNEPSIPKFKTQQAKDAVRKYEEKLKSIQTRLKELEDEAKEAFAKDLRETMKFALDANDVDEVQKISTFLSGSVVTPPEPENRRTARSNAEIQDLRSQVDAYKKLANVLHPDHEFLHSMFGKTFIQSTQPGASNKTWAFNSDGTLSINQQLAGRWVVIGDRTILTMLAAGGHVDVFRFSPDGKTAEVRYVGDGSKSRVFTGVLAK